MTADDWPRHSKTNPYLVGIGQYTQLSKKTTASTSCRNDDQRTRHFTLVQVERVQATATPNPPNISGPDRQERGLLASSLPFLQTQGIRCRNDTLQARRPAQRLLSTGGRHLTCGIRLASGNILRVHRGGNHVRRASFLLRHQPNGHRCRGERLHHLATGWWAVGGTPETAARRSAAAFAHQFEAYEREAECYHFVSCPSHPATALANPITDTSWPRLHEAESGGMYEDLGSLPFVWSVEALRLMTRPWTTDSNSPLLGGYPLLQCCMYGIPGTQCEKYNLQSIIHGRMSFY